jgi:hypothetical protein
MVDFALSEKCLPSECPQNSFSCSSGNGREHFCDLIQILLVTLQSRTKEMQMEQVQQNKSLNVDEAGDYLRLKSPRWTTCAGQHALDNMRWTTCAGRAKAQAFANMANAYSITLNSP